MALGKKSGRKVKPRVKGVDIHITLPDGDLRLLKKLKDSGDYSSNTDVLRDALRHLAQTKFP